MVLLKGFRLVATGSVIRPSAAYAFSSVLVSEPTGVSVTDPLTFGVAAAVVVLVGLTACLLPARQAVHVDPLVALRCGE